MSPDVKLDLYCRAYLAALANDRCRGSEDANPEGVRESLAKRLRGFDDPRFEALRTIYAEAVRAVGGEP